MAKRIGVSSATVQRIWSDLGLQPHRVDRFKVSNDPLFEDKLIDVVGLYLNPPERASVLCMDEKSQIQALDRTQASLPMVPGRAGTMTRDYKRNGTTTTLFAALDVLTGTVIGQCRPRRRHTEFIEFIEFLNTIDREVPVGVYEACRYGASADREDATGTEVAEHGSVIEALKRRTVEHGAGVIGVGDGATPHSAELGRWSIRIVGGCRNRTGTDCLPTGQRGICGFAPHVQARTVGARRGPLNLRAQGPPGHLRAAQSTRPNSLLAVG